MIIYEFKTDVKSIIGSMGEGKEYTTPFTAIRTPGLWNEHDRIRGVYPRASKSSQEQRLNIQPGINRELGRHMEARLLVSELLGKCSVLWYQLAA